MVSVKSMSNTSSKAVKKVKNSVSRVSNETTSFLQGQVMFVRLLCIALLLCVKFLPNCCLDALDITWVRVVVALVVVALLFADCLSATILTVAYLVGVQESRSRKSVKALMNNKFEDVIVEEEETNGLLPESSYGSPDDLLAKKSVEDHLNYENQIGDFDITPDLKKMKGENYRINMSQSSEKIGATPELNSSNQVVKVNNVSKEAGEGFADVTKEREFAVFRNDMGQRQQSPNTPGLAEKDCVVDKVYGIQHPASKTMTQNLKEEKEAKKLNAFTNEQHLHDAQVNTAQGSDVEVPCGIEVMPNMWNTQGLKPSPITGFDSDACNASKV
jgi:hypothetical protein